MSPDAVGKRAEEEIVVSLFVPIRRKSAGPAMSRGYRYQGQRRIAPREALLPHPLVVPLCWSGPWPAMWRKYERGIDSPLGAAHPSNGCSLRVISADYIGLGSNRRVRTYTLCFFVAERVGLIRIGLGRSSPLWGALRASKFAVQICRTGFSSLTLYLKQKWGRKGPNLCFWRRGWDSNPRRATNPCWFSRPVHSTTLPPLQAVLAVRRRILRAASEYFNKQDCCASILLNCACFSAAMC